jgi:hypothetical protein
MFVHFVNNHLMKEYKMKMDKKQGEFIMLNKQQKLKDKWI